jgi:hypothetical protein
MSDLALITKEDLNKSGQLTLNEAQLNLVLAKTPAKYVKSRPAKGGGTWDYVTGGYVKKMLNLMFGWDWDFEITDEKILIEAGEVVVKGRLTCRVGDKTIVKMQFGNKDIMFKNDWVDGKKVKTNIPLSVGNDMKAAATDCLKKCAAELGIASDIYNKEDFVNTKVSTSEDLKEILESLFKEKREVLSESEITAIEQIIIEETSTEYKRTINNLKKR